MFSNFILHNPKTDCINLPNKLHKFKFLSPTHFEQYNTNMNHMTKNFQTTLSNLQSCLV